MSRIYHGLQALKKLNVFCGDGVSLFNENKKSLYNITGIGLGVSFVGISSIIGHIHPGVQINPVKMDVIDISADISHDGNILDKDRQVHIETITPAHQENKDEIISEHPLQTAAYHVNMEKINPNDAPDIAKPVHDAIMKASKKSGVRADILGAMAYIETRFDNHAKAHQSSASGLFQFTKESWLYSLMKYGKEIGLESVASTISQAKNGNMVVKSQKDYNYIMSLRSNSNVSSMLTAQSVLNNKKLVEIIKGKQANAGDIYLTHVVGPSGIIKIQKALQTKPNESIELILGKNVVHNNKHLFVNEDGKVKSVREAYKDINQIVNEAKNYFHYAVLEMNKSKEMKVAISNTGMKHEL